MSYADDKQHLMEDIVKEPARFLMEQFDEGNIFYDKEWRLNAYTLEDLPVIMRLENADDIYLTATTWWLGDTCYRRIEQQAHTHENEGWLPLPLTHSYSEYEAIQLFRGEWWELEQAAVGVAANEWREITVDIKCRRPTAVYAWFFPCGLKPAMRRDGMSMHVNNRPNK